MNEGMENLKEIEALKQQLYTERESLKKEADELMMKKIEHYEKEIALVREDAQVQILRLDKRIGELAKEKDVELTYSVKRINELLKISEDHQKLNGQLQEKLSKYEDKAAHYRRKAVL